MSIVNEDKSNSSKLECQKVSKKRYSRVSTRVSKYSLSTLICTFLVEIIIFSQYHFIFRPIKIINKIAKFSPSKSIFYVKNYPNLSKKNFQWRIWILEHTFFYWHFFNSKLQFLNHLIVNFWWLLLDWTQD